MKVSTNKFILEKYLYITLYSLFIIFSRRLSDNSPCLRSIYITKNLREVVTVLKEPIDSMFNTDGTRSNERLKVITIVDWSYKLGGRSEMYYSREWRKL